MVRKSCALGNWAVSVGWSGVCAASGPDSTNEVAAAMAIAKRLKRMDNIRIRLAPGFTARTLGQSRMRKPTGSIKLPDNAAFGVRPQGSAADPGRQTITL